MRKMAIMKSSIMQLMADANNLPALSLAVVERGKISHTHTAGPAVSPTRFPVACLGKPITALALFLLEEDGRLRLDDSVSRYLPLTSLPRPVEAASEITIRQLLSHRAGVIRGRFAQRRRTSEEYASELRESELAYLPGTRYKFSNLGYFLCGALIEAVSNVSYEEFVKDRIFRPLGMDSATFTRPPAVPEGHSRGEYYALVHPDDDLQPAPTFPLSAAAGGFYSTAADYARFLAAIISEEAVAAPLSPRVREKFQERRILRYTGSNSGYSSLMMGDVKTGNGAVAFCNRSNASACLEDLIAIAGTQIDRIPATRPESFADDFGCGQEVLRIHTNGRGLCAEMGGARFQLRPRSEKTFVADSGPFREYLLRFRLSDGRPRACSAGRYYFDLGGSTETASPPPWQEIAGRYEFPNYATAEIFSRRGRLYCLCSPLHEMRLIPRAPDLFTLQNGLFAGEAFRVRRSGTNCITGIEMGGMQFVRKQC
jgi:CubicO group peptidase (beta-lactamase class C family)